jgi:apolipoprotein N-acyltransferase
MYSIKESSRPFLNSFIFAATFNAVALHWTSIYVGSLPWIILFIGQGFMSIPLGLAKKYGVGFYPLIFLAMEEVRVRFPFGGFGWLRLAYSQADAPYRAIAAYGGVSALTAIVLCFGLVGYGLLTQRLVLLPLFPLLLLIHSLPVHTIGTTKVLMVQGDVPQLGLDFNSRAQAVFHNHVKETRMALKQDNKIDFILWPENAIDIDPFTEPHVAEALNSFQTPLIVGAVVTSKGPLQNVSIHWTKQTQNVYVKQHLTPFGEYIPLRTIAEKISPLARSLEDFSAGSQSASFRIGSAQIAPVICFELIDDAILKKAAGESNLIVVQTNSATFGTSAQSAQQLQISRIRAIEHGRNILSVSTTGISAVINFEGKIEEKTAQYEPAHIVTTVNLIDSTTPRDKAGDWALIATGAWLRIVARRRLYT